MKRDRLGERLLIIYALNIIDVIYTMYFAVRFGIQIEANSYALKLWNNNPTLLVVFKLFGVGLLLIVIYLLRKYRAADFASKVFTCDIWYARCVSHCFAFIGYTESWFSVIISQFTKL